MSLEERRQNRKDVIKKYLHILGKIDYFQRCLELHREYLDGSAAEPVPQLMGLSDMAIGLMLDGISKQQDYYLKGIGLLVQTEIMETGLMPDLAVERDDVYPRNPDDYLADLSEFFAMVTANIPE